MRQELILPPLLRRLTDRWTGVVVLCVGGILCLFPLLDSRHPVSAVDWLLPFLAVYLHLSLAPVPWQWNGASPSKGRLVRGLLAALLFNALWIAALLLLGHLLHPNPMHGGPMHFNGMPGGPMYPGGPPPDWGPGFPPPRPRMLNPGWGLGLVNLAFALLVGWVIAEKEAMAAREQVTAELLRQAESKALQNQLEPHVLYNALSSLSELIYEDPLAAESVITQLADLYRRLSHHGKQARVPLGEERRLVEAYLTMEQMRLGERLQVAWSWPDWADALALPPHFLQPQVENAIKHGIGPYEVGGEVRITCTRDGARITLQVENSGLAPAETTTGIGLGNLRARLALWSGAEGTFTLERQGDWTVASLHWNNEGAA